MSAHHDPTSISDFSTYRSACAAAANDPELFRSFRRKPEISGIIEPFIAEGSPGARFIPTSHELMEWLVREPDFGTRYPSFQLNDTIGEPHLVTVEGLGQASIYTLRYIKIAYDLRRLFGSLDGLHIVEIGGGYGGQCAILSRLFTWASYTIVDLPEVLSLQRTYLEALGVANVQLRTREELDAEQPCDAVISNYAYSELSEELRAFYLDRILAKSSRGYMLWNYQIFTFVRHGEDFMAALKDELEVFAKILERVPNLRFVDHLRLSNDIEYRSHVAVWGNNG